MIRFAYRSSGSMQDAIEVAVRSIVTEGGGLSQAPRFSGSGTNVLHTHDIGLIPRIVAGQDHMKRMEVFFLFSIFEHCGRIVPPGGITDNCVLGSCSNNTSSRFSSPTNF